MLNQPLQCSLILYSTRLEHLSRKYEPTDSKDYLLYQLLYTALNQARIQHVSPDLQILPTETYWAPINPKFTRLLSLGSAKSKILPSLNLSNKYRFVQYMRVPS